MSSTQNKNWSYQKQSEADIYEYLNGEGRFLDMPEKKAHTAVKYYVTFCNKFKGNRIPDTFGIQYISTIKLGPAANCFLFSFKGEKYLFTKDNAFKMIAPEDAKKGSLNNQDIKLTPTLDKIDWRFQNLSSEDIYKYFSNAKLFKNTCKHKFDVAAQQRAAEFYRRRCAMASDHRLSEELAIDNVQRIEIDENGYNFRFYFKGTNVFYYFGYPEGSSTFAVW